MGLTVDTGPAVEPLRVDETAEQLGTLPEQDEHVDALIAAARDNAETYLGRALITQTLVLTLDSFPCGRILVPRPPLQSVTWIKYIDESGVQQTLNPSKYRVSTSREPGEIERAYGESWPSIRPVMDAVEIKFVAGYGDDGTDVPKAIKQAMLLMVGEWLEYREGVQSNMRPITNSVEMLLRRYRLGSLFAGAGVGK